jgi:hypothetical protein
VVPPGRGPRASEEPEDAGGAAVEKDVLKWVHGDEGSMHMIGGGFIAGPGLYDDDSVRRWLGTVPGTLAIWCRRSGVGG